MTDMTPREIRDACNEMAKGIGERAKVFIGFSGAGPPLYAQIYTNWPMGDTVARVVAYDFGEALRLLKDAWIEHQDEHHRRTINKMALEIIRITDEQGECTDASLRGTCEFTDADVAQYGPDACAKADEMAGRGPFEIVALRGANAA